MNLGTNETAKLQLLIPFQPLFQFQGRRQNVARTGDGQNQVDVLKIFPHYNDRASHVLFIFFCNQSTRINLILWVLF